MVNPNDVYLYPAATNANDVMLRPAGYTLAHQVSISEMAIETPFMANVSLPLTETGTQTPFISNISLPLTEIAQSSVLMANASIPLTEAALEGFSYSAAIPLNEIATSTGIPATVLLTENAVELLSYVALIPLNQSSIQGLNYVATIPLLETSVEALSYVATIPLTETSVQILYIPTGVLSVNLTEVSTSTGASAVASLTESSQGFLYNGTVTVTEYAIQPLQAFLFLQTKILFKVGNVAINLATGELSVIIE
jgi:hypothetical protein